MGLCNVVLWCKSSNDDGIPQWNGVYPGRPISSQGKHDQGNVIFVGVDDATGGFHILLSRDVEVWVSFCLGEVACTVVPDFVKYRGLLGACVVHRLPFVIAYDGIGDEEWRGVISSMPQPSGVVSLLPDAQLLRVCIPERIYLGVDMRL